MVLWPLDSSEKAGKRLPLGRWPWLVLCLLVTSAGLFAWGQQGSKGHTDKMNQAREQMLCAYLQNDHIALPQADRVLFPKAVQRHAQRLDIVLESYHSKASERRKARQWLQGDGGLGGAFAHKIAWEEKPQKVPCLQFAIAQGQLRRGPRKRAYLKLAQSSAKTLSTQTQRISTRIAGYRASRRRIPSLYWGFVPVEMRWPTLLTALFFHRDVLLMLLQLCLLWFVGGLFEKRWGTPLFTLAFFLMGGGGFLFWKLLFPESAHVFVGFGVALAGLMGAWTVLFGLGNLRIVLGIPWTRLQSSLPLPGAVFLALWLLTEGIEFSQYPEISTLWMAPHLSFFFLSALFATVFLRKGVSSTFDDFDDELEFAEPATLLKPIRLPKASDEGTEALAKHAQEAATKGAHKEAIVLYRQALKTGKAPVTVYRGLFLSCKTARVSPLLEECIQAIRAAVVESQFNKVQEFYELLLGHYENSHIAPRQRIALANDLKRASLFREAALQAGKIAQKGPHNPFFIQSLLLQADCMFILIEQGSLQQLSSEENKAVIELSKNLFGADEYLPLFPEYEERLRKTQARAESLLGDLTKEIQHIQIHSEPSLSDTQDETELFEALNNLGKEGATFTWTELPSVREINLDEDPLLFDFETWSGEWDTQLESIVSEMPHPPEELSRDNLPRAERMVASPDLLMGLMEQPWKMESSLQDAVDQENVILLTEELDEIDDPELGMLAPIIGTLLEEAPTPPPLPAPPRPEDIPILELYEEVEDGSFDFDGWSGEWDMLIEEAETSSQESLAAYQLATHTAPANFAVEVDDAIAAQFDTATADRVITTQGTLEELMSEPWKMESQLYNAIGDQSAMIVDPSEYEHELDLVLGVLIEEDIYIPPQPQRIGPASYQHRTDLTTLELDAPVMPASTDLFFAPPEDTSRRPQRAPSQPDHSGEKKR